MGSRKREVSEKLVRCIWLDQCIKEDKLKTIEGEKVEIISPGWWNLEGGPDFKRAVIKISPACRSLGAGRKDKTLRGDIEVHVYTSDWKAHGHHRDEKYEGTILHVVMWNDRKKGIVRKKNGENISTLALKNFLSERLSKLKSQIKVEDYPHTSQGKGGFCPPNVRSKTPQIIASILDSAGDKRLFLKSNRFEERLKGSTYDEVLYQGIMEALGYKKNKKEFLELSKRVSLERIRRVLSSGREGLKVRRLQALFFGVCGLLPEETSENLDWESKEYIRSLRSFWQKVEPNFNHRKMSNFQFQFGVRPANSPLRRIAGMTYLLVNCQKRGFFSTFLSLFEKLREEEGKRKKRKEIREELKRLFIAKEGDYWISRSFWGGRKGRPIRLIGESTILNILVNIVIPIMLLFAKKKSRRALRRELLELYADFPKLAPNNVTRFMCGQVFGQDKRKASLINSARRQQGLIHLYNQFCDHEERRCACCPLMK